MSSRSRTDVPGPRLALPLGPLALLLVAGSVVVAGVVGYLLALWIGPGEPWAAALGAGLGMTLTAVPLGAVLLGLARAASSEPPRAAAPPPSGGAMSRDQFVDLAGREWARARRYGSGAALLLVEVDRFPRLVEGFGRAAGAAVLQVLVRDIGATLRGADALAYYGEGQLAVFLAQADATGALDVAERIRERIELLEVPHEPKPLQVTVSVGVAHLRPAHLHLQALLEDAADAVFAARQAGGNCVRAAPVEFGRLSSPDAHRNDQRAPKP
jgi:diguanylate cyclase (GGDEF)-like protein